MNKKFSYSPADCRLVRAADFLRANPRRGRAFQLRHLSLEFYGIRDCLVLGGSSQTVLPLAAPPAQAGAPHLPYLFLESCPYSSNEQYLTGLAARALAEPAAGRDLPEVEEAVPLNPPGAPNLWHWMTESLPKLLALESIGYQGRYIIPADPAGVPAQSLEFLGIAPERLLFGSASCLVKNLILPPRLAGFHLAGNMPLASLLREKILAAAGATPAREPGQRRIYLRRIGNRRVLNEDELLEVIRDFGFTVLVPEELSLAEQWRSFAGAGGFLAAHGAGSAHSLLLAPGAPFLELFSNRYVSYNNLHAVRLLRLRYYPLVQDLDVTASPCGPGRQCDIFQYLLDGIPADITVDPVHLRIALEGMYDQEANNQH
ncbi:MAG: glycosyltransferase family 61 protein [Deltaproteobacteria bacterium]|jgi:hypothetical protein|nr:glycosyltransferase family 61 protein [Deltaproteobacteria bacterium]